MTESVDELRRLRFQGHLAAALGEVRRPDKALRVSLRETRAFFGASHGCVAVLEPGRSEAEIEIGIPPDTPWDRGLLTEFLNRSYPEIPDESILAPLRSRRRTRTLIALRRENGVFDRADARALSEVATVISSSLQSIDRERVREIRGRIDRKIMEELRPKDLFYQILHGLRSLTRYDHSSALLIAEPGGAVLTLVAEQIAWRKAKSERIGLRLPLTDEHRRLLTTGVVYGFDRQDDRWEEWEGRDAGALAGLLGRSTASVDAGSGPRRGSLLCAPLATRDAFLGLLLVVAQHPGSFGPYEAELITHFLPHASVAIQNSRRHEALRERILAAERKHAMADLSRGVSHDINNALGAVLPLVQQIREDLEEDRMDTATLTDDVEQIEDSLQVCRRIFAGMLGFARGSARGLGRHDVARALDGTLAILRDGLRRRGIELRLDIEDDLPTVRGRQGDLDQLLLNLATNARDAMPEGGTLTLAARRDGDRLEVLIRDTGAGITAEDMARIHEPFFSTKEQGSGLGLSICNSIVSDMHGRLEIESVSGRGTTVRVSLPAGDAA